MGARLLFVCLLTFVSLGAPGCRGFQRKNDALVGFNEAAWTQLGERRVSFAFERDTVHVTNPRGRYRKLTLVVRDSALEMYDVVVTFVNGDVYSPTTRLVFGADSRSRVIDLPGARRAIKKVEFRYRSRNVFTGFAEIELWGKR